MIRKHFRFKRFALGLAFAAVAIPVAPAGAVGLSTYVDGGRALVGTTPITSYTPSYLRYHEVGVPVAAGAQARSEHSASVGATELQRFFAFARATQPQPTITPLQADGMRWNAMARFYQAQQQQSQPVAPISERSNYVQPAQAISERSIGFDWKDAGIGASTVLATALLLGIALIVTRRHHHTGLTNA